jgi:hypothetical protein
MPLPAPYAGDHPLGDVVRREIARRRKGFSMEPGAAHVDGHFLRFEDASVLGVRPWGPESGAWLLFTAWPHRWRSVEPWLDLRALNLAAPRPASPGARRRSWRHSYRQLRLAFPGDALARAWNERAAALPDALLPVPDWAIDQAARLLPDRQWRILQFLNATRERGRDLCRSNLPLAFLLASRGEKATVPPAEAVSWKQRRILAAFGFPAQEAAVRVLRRVDDRALCSPLLAHLRRWMREPACLRRLGHVARVGAAGLSLRTPAELAWIEDRALPEILATDDPETLRALEEFTGLARRLQELGYGLQGRLSSAAQVSERSATLRRYLQELANLPAGRALPDPPVPGVPGVIEPLRTVRDVHQEGERMRHCVRTYLNDAMQRRVALYRVLRPQRATLSLVPRGRRWRLDELWLCANATPSWECFASVGQWLRANAPAAPRRRRAQPPLLVE